MMASLQKKVEAQEEYIRKLEHERLVSSYQKQAEDWTTLSVDPVEVGKELADLHESAGEAAANRAVSMYQKAAEMAVDTAITTQIGTSRRNGNANQPDAGQTDAFHKEVEEYAANNNIPFPKALLHFSKTRPREFQEYQRRVAKTMYGGSN